MHCGKKGCLVMRVMIDANVLLDVLIHRDEFFDDSKAVLKLCEDRTIQGFVSASAITDIFYITRKALGSIDDTYQVIGSLLNIVRVLTVTNEDVLQAYQARAKDFEDRLLAVCAKSNQCDGIVTRNKKDFLSFDIALYTPAEMLRLFADGKNGVKQG